MTVGVLFTILYLVGVTISTILEYKINGDGIFNLDSSLWGLINTCAIITIIILAAYWLEETWNYSIF